MRPMTKNKHASAPLSHRWLAPALLIWSLLASPPGRCEDSAIQSLAEAAKPLVYALTLVGTPYRPGGSDPQSGLDCSGLVKHVYAQTAELELPRTAAAISQQGEPVEQEQLKPGDLVFFNTLRRPFSHVGIYKGEGKFVHASSTRTGRVLVSDMNKRYWAKRFDGARRLLSQ